MSDNKRNVDTNDLSQKSDGPQNPSGQGANSRNRVEAEAEAKDNRQAGREGRAKGQGGGA